MPPRWAFTVTERLRTRVILEVLIAAAFDLDTDALFHALDQCDLPADAFGDRTLSEHLNPKGFWRVDRDRPPELRHTVLTLVAFHDLATQVKKADGDRQKGIEAFLSQNQGDGWMLPETLCLADYGLGHDDRARRPQPVASRLGPVSSTGNWPRVQRRLGVSATSASVTSSASAATNAYLRTSSEGRRAVKGRAPTSPALPNPNSSTTRRDRSDGPSSDPTSEAPEPEHRENPVASRPLPPGQLAVSDSTCSRPPKWCLNWAIYGGRSFAEATGLWRQDPSSACGTAELARLLGISSR